MQRNLFSEAMQSRRGGGPTQDWSKEKKILLQAQQKKSERQASRGEEGKESERKRWRHARVRGIRAEDSEKQKRLG